MSIPEHYRMPFGEHKGIEIGSVPASYLDWLAGQSWMKKFPKILMYIKENREHIDRELKLEDD